MLRSGEPLENKVKLLMKEGKKTVGSWLQMGSNISAEVLAKAKPDWLLVDMEHGPGDIMTLISQIQAIENFDVVPIVRAPWNDLVIIKRILDSGALGVLIPYVGTAEEAAQAVRACKYPPEGIRGIALSARAPGFAMNGKKYVENANDSIIVMVQIETPQGVENIDAIAATEGVDVIFIGPMDLSTSMGYFANPKADEVQKTIRYIEERVKLSGKLLGTVANGMQEAKVLYDRGYSFVVPMSDSTALGALGTETFKTFHTMYPNR